MPRWQTTLAFLSGFFLQFNILVGGNGEGAAATGGYGYRIYDFLCVLLIGMLGIRALAPQRLMPVLIFAAAVFGLAALPMLQPAFSDDGRTVILAVHYIGYSFAGLYVAILLDEASGREAYCWGLVLGLLAASPIFFMQANGYDSKLVALGLLPGYFPIYTWDIGDVARYSGLWGHPNEAAHVAALSAPAAAYFFIIRRRVLPLALTGGALLAVFYYTQSRGGLIAGGGLLATPFLFGRGGRFSVLRLVIAGVVLLVGVELISGIGFVSFRFDDASIADNFAERLDSQLVGLQVALTHPFGLSISDFYSMMSAGTGGITSPHNGFTFFAAIFGWLPFAALIAAIIRSFFVRSEADMLFSLISVGLCFSFMFEQLPESYPVAFVICLIVGRAYVMTAIGSSLLAAAPGHGSAAKSVRRRLRPTFPARTVGSAGP